MKVNVQVNTGFWQYHTRSIDMEATQEKGGLRLRFCDNGQPWNWTLKLEPGESLFIPGLELVDKT